MDLRSLDEAIEHAAGIGRTLRMQPLAGRGSKIFPSTHPSERKETVPNHVFERRRIGDADIMCAELDSVQSQANRMEAVLFERAGPNAGPNRLPIPYVSVDFRDLGDDASRRWTSLEAPHRVYDAAFRDSTLNGVQFMESATGRALASAKPSNASALLEHCPADLVFGAWHSQGPKGQSQAKFKRLVVSEIMAIHTPHEEVVIDARSGETEVWSAGRQSGSRIDDLGILRAVEIWKTPSGWDTSEAAAGAGAVKARPAEINHGSIPPTVRKLGVTCDYAEQSFTLSFNHLRWLGFGSEARTRAGKALLASLGLVGITALDARGYALRSRCDLVAENDPPFALIPQRGEREPIAVDAASAEGLYREAYARAQSEGFTFRWLTLEPQEKLIHIVRESQRLALERRGDDDDGAEGSPA